MNDLPIIIPNDVILPTTEDLIVIGAPYAPHPLTVQFGSDDPLWEWDDLDGITVGTVERVNGQVEWVAGFDGASGIAANMDDALGALLDEVLPALIRTEEQAADG